MAVSLTDKIHVVRDSIPTENLGSALANSGRDAVSVQEILELSGSVETGTWTPIISAYIGGSLTPVYLKREGTYSLSGDVVTITYDVKISNASTISGSGNIIVFDFPFVIDTTKAFSSVTGKTKGTLKLGTTGGNQFNNNGTYFDYLEVPTNSSPTYQNLKSNNISVSIFGELHFTGIVTYTKL